MADIESLKQIICIYERILRLYESHHPHCTDISRDRVALDQALATLRKERNSLEKIPSSNDPNEFQIIQYSGNPINDSNTQRKKRKIDERVPNRKLAEVAFLRNIPEVKEWETRLSNISTAVPESAGLAAPPTPGQLTDLAHRTKGVPATLVETAEYHAQQTALWIAQAESTSSFCRFQLFCFFSFCVVLESRKDVALEDLNRIMRVVVVRNGTEKYLKQLRTSARLMHTGVVLELVKAGWSLSQATLMFFFCKRQPPPTGYY